MNYDTRSPVASGVNVAEGIRDHFGNDVVRTVHVSIDFPACCRAKEATFDALARVMFVMSQDFAIEKTALASVTLLGAVDSQAYQRRFVFQHRNEAVIWQHYEVLVGP